MFHFPNIEWTRLQAEAAGLPHMTEKTKGVKEVELEDLGRAIRRAKEAYELEGVYTGALASVYQRVRVETICNELELQCVSPLWGIDPEQHLRRLVSDGFVVMVVSVSALGLDKSWLGRIIDHPAIDDLVRLGRKFKFHVGLEGGEGETFVLDSPLFTSRVVVENSTKHWKGESGFLQITKARLVPKA